MALATERTNILGLVGAAQSQWRGVVEFTLILVVATQGTPVLLDILYALLCGLWRAQAPACTKNAHGLGKNDTLALSRIDEP